MFDYKEFLKNTLTGYLVFGIILGLVSTLFYYIYYYDLGKYIAFFIMFCLITYFFSLVGKDIRKSRRLDK